MASDSDADEWVKVEQLCPSAEASASHELQMHVDTTAPIHGGVEPSPRGSATASVSATPRCAAAGAPPPSPCRAAEAAAGGAPDAGIQLELRPHVDGIHVGEHSEVLGMASIRVPGIGSTPRLSRLDVVAVIDRSGSMSGVRIQLVRKAIGFMSKQLRSGDRLALVSYSDTATVDLPLTLMDDEGKAECAQALEGMHARGGTNLGEGLLWGLGELGSSDAPAAAMLLFTDGLANKGMTNTEALLQAMEGPMSDMGRQSRAVFCFGFGSDHNAQMLFSLADAGTGCYHYVDTPQAIAPSFADCLGGMLSVAAQDVMLTLDASEGVSIHKVYADFNIETSANNMSSRIKMRDLSGDAEKEVLFNLHVPAFEVARETWPVLRCTLSYVDVADGTPKVEEGTLTLCGFHEPDRSVIQDAEVEAHRCRLLTAAAMEQAVVILGKGAKIPDAQDVLSQALEAVEKSPARAMAVGKAHDRIGTLIADLRMCLESTTDPRECEKWCSSRAFAHKHQISTRAEGSEYRNSLQRRLADAARKEIGEGFHAGKSPRNQGRSGRNQPRFQPPRRVSEQAGLSAKADSNAIQAGALRVGMRVICHGMPGLVQEVTHSKTGKHGHAKVFFSALGDDGVLRQDIVPAVGDVEFAPERR